jgi:hypothetical protein
MSEGAIRIESVHDMNNNAWEIEVQEESGFCIIVLSLFIEDIF